MRVIHAAVQAWIRSNSLASAPRTWYREVCRRLKTINFTQHSLDHLLFYKREGDKLLAICIVYVDDVLLSCREDYKKEEFYDLFKLGSEKELTLTEPLEFKGKEISLIEQDGKFNLKVTQKRFIKNTEPGKVARGRIAEGPPLKNKQSSEASPVQSNGLLDRLDLKLEHGFHWPTRARTRAQLILPSFTRRWTISGRIPTLASSSRTLL